MFEYWLKRLASIGVIKLFVSGLGFLIGFASLRYLEPSTYVYFGYSLSIITIIGGLTSAWASAIILRFWNNLFSRDRVIFQKNFQVVFSIYFLLVVAIAAYFYGQNIFAILVASAMSFIFVIAAAIARARKKDLEFAVWSILRTLAICVCLLLLLYFPTNLSGIHLYGFVIPILLILPFAKNIWHKNLHASPSSDASKTAEAVKDRELFYYGFTASLIIIFSSFNMLVLRYISHNFMATIDAAKIATLIDFVERPLMLFASVITLGTSVELYNIFDNKSRREFHLANMKLIFIVIICLCLLTYLYIVFGQKVILMISDDKVNLASTDIWIYLIYTSSMIFGHRFSILCSVYKKNGYNFISYFVSSLFLGLWVLLNIKELTLNTLLWGTAYSGVVFLISSMLIAAFLSFKFKPSDQI